jgi:hypothetical protein
LVVCRGCLAAVRRGCCSAAWLARCQPPRDPCGDGLARQMAGATETLATYQFESTANNEASEKWLISGLQRYN